MTFGFREPYQVLVDAEIVRDSCQFKMDLAPALQRTVHGQVKPMITQCEIRKLYALKAEPGVAAAIELAKTFERRRCGHHPDEYPEPLPTTECTQSVVDPKGTGQNKHRYVVASQGQEVRRMLRAVRGVPLIYIKRSVMILEPMADESAQLRAREEKMKFRAEIKKPLGKRKRDAEEDQSDDESEGPTEKQQRNETAAKNTTGEKKKPQKTRGPKGPNPLAVKKAKKGSQDGASSEPRTDAPAKRKRRRKTKTKDDGNPTSTTDAPTAASEE